MPKEHYYQVLFNYKIKCLFQRLWAFYVGFRLAIRHMFSSFCLKMTVKALKNVFFP